MSQRVAKSSTSNLKELVASRADLAGYALILLPLLVYWVYWMLNPSYWFNGDPAAYYMIDSLSVFGGRSYTYVDHPGTPVQVAGTAMMAATYPIFGSRQALIDFYLRRPEVFFMMANVLLLAANILTIIVFYRTARKVLGRNSLLEAAAVSLLYFAISSFSFPSLTFWSHNSLNFAFGTLLLLWLFNELLKEKDLKPIKLLLIGFASGVLAIAQVYFFIWMATCTIAVFVFTFRLHRSFRRSMVQSLYMVAGGLLGNVIMLLPIYKELPRFLDWALNVATHSQIYGTGERGIFPLSLIPTALGVWWISARPMLITLILVVVGLVLVAFLRRKNPASVEPAIYAMTVAMAFQVFLLLIPLIKAALKVRYTLSLAATLPILVLLLLKLSEGFVWHRVAFTRIISVLVLLSVGRSLILEMNQAQRRAFVEQEAVKATDRAEKLLAKQMHVPKEDLVVVYAYGTPLKCSALLQASSWTGAFKDKVAALCPNQYAIFDYDLQFNTYEPVLDLKDIDWDLVVWPGTSSNLPAYLESVGAVTIPDSWRLRRDKWFYIHSEVLNQ
jgi:hypothetical protein